jgi:hypothetical protein
MRTFPNLCLKKTNNCYAIHTLHILIINTLTNLYTY